MANVGQNLRVTSVQTFTPAGLPGTVTPFSQNQSFVFNPGNGTGADNINETYIGTTSLNAAPVVLNLQSLTDPGGGTFNFVRVRSIYINNKCTNNSLTLTVGYATNTTNCWTGILSNPGTLTIPSATASNQAMFVMTAPNTTGWVVSSGSKLLQLDPGAGAFDVDVVITGVLS